MVVLLSAFVTLCEGYLGILPKLELWGEFFYTKLGTYAKGKAAQCGTFVAVRRPSADNCFPAISLTQSVKLWQKSYFYVKNVHPTADFINLPAYVAGPPAEPRTNWTFKPKTLSAASSTAIARLKVRPVDRLRGAPSAPS